MTSTDQSARNWAFAASAVDALQAALEIGRAALAESNPQALSELELKLNALMARIKAKKP